MAERGAKVVAFDYSTKMIGLAKKRRVNWLDKIEMLFIAPEQLREGVGKELIELALTQFAVKYVDVNEQNPGAVGFYKHIEFDLFERT